MNRTLLAGIAAVLGLQAAAAAPVTYEAFGAVGDGVHDDRAAIVAAHREANAKGLPVRARDGATYYVGCGVGTASVRTDVDFGTATIVIDDRTASGKPLRPFANPSAFAATKVVCPETASAPAAMHDAESRRPPCGRGDVLGAAGASTPKPIPGTSPTDRSAGRNSSSFAISRACGISCANANRAIRQTGESTA